jgi:uncharacterized protein YodC (DUF2158 family)
MEPLQYTKGDLVQLKSGGPVMTVFSTPETAMEEEIVPGIPFPHRHEYTCHWFAGKKLESGSFDFEELKPADPNAK